MRRTSLMLVVLFGVLGAAEKKPMDHSVYDQWKSITEKKISNDGNWVLYKVEPQEGDANLFVKNLQDFGQTIVPRGESAKFTYDSKHIVFKIKPPFKETRQAKIDKKKDNEMPAPGLGVVQLGSSDVVEFERVKSYKLPKEAGGFVAIQLMKEQAKKDTTASDSTDYVDADKNNTKKKTGKGTHLVVYHLADSKKDTLKFVSDYTFCEDGTKLLYAVDSNDSFLKSGVYVYDTVLGKSKGLKVGAGSFKNLVWDEPGKQAAFVADMDTSKSKQRCFSLYYWKSDADSAIAIADTSTNGLTDGWMISEYGKLEISQNGKKLFLGTAPVPAPEDTTIVDFEVAKVDIWNWKDPLLQPQQLKELDKERKRSYKAVIHLNDKKFVQLGNLDLPEIKLADEGNCDIALGTSNLPYRQLISWEGAYKYDVFAVSLKDGKKKPITDSLRGSIRISPNGKYVYWFDEEKSHYFAHSIKTEKTVCLTSSIKTSFADELNDRPMPPSAYGQAGWLDDDKAVLLYDRYDIWQFDPEMKKQPQKLTSGRDEKITFRYIRLDPEARSIKSKEPMLLSAFDYKDKSEGFYNLTNGSLEKLIKEDFSLSNPIKAKEKNVFIYTRGSYEIYPDLYASDSKFQNPKQLSKANPQQEEYIWSTAELVKWTCAEGRELEGILYKPENFDPNKKYPMIVYFYERNSNTLHRYLPPRPSPSTVRPSFYCSRGYLFFIPDIVYNVGYPGKSAEKCVIPGVLNILDRGYVDRDRIGVQGQSWGGYQVAHLVTRTNLFAAAMAGAPVSNMYSAYGGIRWGSGLSRMFQYEHTQSRIGGTIWDRPLYYWENSPLFKVPDIQTPLLIMHNDNDGAVPWYQGIELFVAMRRLGKPAWLLNYNGEEHNLVKRQNRKDLSKRMQQFFDHYLKDEPAPEWMTKGVPAVMKGKSWGFDLSEE